MSVHGGDIYRNHVDIDFSINVNPFGTPGCVKKALYGAVEMCGKYPDMEAEKLGEAVSMFLGVPREYLLFGNGASELFMAVAHGIKPKKVVIPVPSFYGYEYAAKAVDSEIIFYKMNQDSGFCMTEDIIRVLTEDVDLLFLASPNNPVGNLLDMELVKKLLLHCRQQGIYVVIDECFIEFCGNQFSLLPNIREFEHLIIVRAFTKIFRFQACAWDISYVKVKSCMQKQPGSFRNGIFPVLRRKRDVSVRSRRSLSCRQNSILKKSGGFWKKD